MGPQNRVRRAWGGGPRGSSPRSPPASLAFSWSLFLGAGCPVQAAHGAGPVLGNALGSPCVLSHAADCRVPLPSRALGQRVGVLAAPHLTADKWTAQPCPPPPNVPSSPGQTPARGSRDAGLQLDRRSPLGLAALPPTPPGQPHGPESRAVGSGGCGQSLCRLGGDLGPRKSLEEGPCGSACGPELQRSQEARLTGTLASDTSPSLSKPLDSG